MMLLEVKDLTKEYKRNNLFFQAVRHANLNVDAGDFVSIIGRSGSGKSTLLNMITGLLNPSSGNVNIAGKSIQGLSDLDLSHLRNSQIGYVPQGMSLLANLSVLENISLPAFLFKNNNNKHTNGDEIAERSLALLDQTGTSHLAASYPKQLSGGELRRVSIARALINKPALLIADEPTGDLDAETTAGIMDLFRGIARKGTAVLIVTHELDTLDYGNRVYRMDAGVLREEAR
ncbi:MAG: ABC transporter ATP-binding protein [Treponema sp.]|jgi:putative ABC transport system ATP-binding protein|nr:ABC transporter ATP-binding protein [Treponema sp.]